MIVAMIECTLTEPEGNFGSKWRCFDAMMTCEKLTVQQ